MPFVILNDAAASFPDQAEPDQVDFAVLGMGQTGVFSGCAVTANGVNMNLSVAAGTVVVNDAPVAVAGGTAVIGAASANNRWDLVYTDSTGSVLVLAGVAASTNATFPTGFNPQTQCLLAAVFIPPSTSALTSNNLVDKRRQLTTGLQRLYADNTGIALLTKISGDTTNRIKVGSDGKIIWTSGSAGTPAPQLAFDATLAGLLHTGKFGATPSAVGEVPLTVTGIGGQTADLFQVRNSTPTVLVKVDASGNLSSFNVKRGAGAPNSSVTGNVGDIYMQTDGAAAATLWIKESGNATNTGWNAAGTTSAGLVLGGGQCPTGTIVEYAGSSLPGGWDWCDGGELSRAGQSSLFAVVGTTWGIGNGSTTFNKPDKRGVVTAGAQNFGGNGTIGDGNRQLGTTISQVVGEKNHFLLSSEVPDVSDVGHVHQQIGRAPTGTIHVFDNGTGTGFEVETVSGAAGYPNVIAGNANIQPADGVVAHNNLQSTQLSRFIIKL